MLKKANLLGAIALCASLGTLAGADTIATWSEGSLNVNTSLTADAGPNAAGCVISRGPGIIFASGAGRYSSNDWDTGIVKEADHYVQITLNSTGYTDPILYFGIRRSGTGPDDFSIEYSTAGVGGPYTVATTDDFGDSTADRFYTVDLSSVAAADNNANLVVRIYGFAAEAAGGTGAILPNPVTAGGDFLRFEGTAIGVPPPSVVTILPEAAATSVKVYWDKPMNSTGTYTANPGAIVASSVVASGNEVTLTFPTPLSTYPTFSTLTISGATSTDTGSFTGSAPTEFAAGTTTLSAIRGSIDVNGIHPNANDVVRTTGIVLEDTLDTSSDKNVIIASGNRGINVFDNFATIGTGLATTLNPGDAISVAGTLGAFNGQLSINRVGASIPFASVTATGQPLPSPTVVPITDGTDSATLEPLEASRVTYTNCAFLAPGPGATWTTPGGSGVNYGFSNQVGDTPLIDLRMDTDAFNAGGWNGQPVIGPRWNVTGIVGQFDSSSPFLGGYQVYVLNYSDITIFSSVSDWQLSE